MAQEPQNFKSYRIFCDHTQLRPKDSEVRVKYTSCPFVLSYFKKVVLSAFLSHDRVCASRREESGGAGE